MHYLSITHSLAIFHFRKHLLVKAPAVVATNVAANTATIAIYLMLISDNWRGHFVYLL
jgi:hypothetical protein